MKTSLRSLAVVSAASVLLLMSCAPRELPGQRARTLLEPLPWHLINLHWDLPASIAIETISIDLTIADDVEDGVQIFVVPMCTHINDRMSYSGFITQVDVMDAMGRLLYDQGRALVFSRWGTTNRNAIRPSTRGWYLASEHEGKHISTRPPFKWGKGKYRMYYTRLDHETIGGWPGIWIGCFVEVVETGERCCVGSLWFQGTEFKVDREVTTFVEIYGRDDPSIAPPHIPNLDIIAGNVCVNRKPADLSSIRAVYFEGIPQHAIASALPRTSQDPNSPPIIGEAPKSL